MKILIFSFFHLSLIHILKTYAKTCKDLTQPILSYFNDSSKSSFLKKTFNFRDYDYDQNNYLDTVNCQIKLNEKKSKQGKKF